MTPSPEKAQPKYHLLLWAVLILGVGAEFAVRAAEHGAHHGPHHAPWWHTVTGSYAGLGLVSAVALVIVAKALMAGLERRGERL